MVDVCLSLIHISRRIKNPRSTVDNDTIGQIYTFSLKEGFVVDLSLIHIQMCIRDSGDEVIIDIWGASQNTIRQQISPDGTINIQKIYIVKSGKIH